jgi:hypothetical protein
MSRLEPARPTYTLVRQDTPLREAPELDAAQQAVVDHPGGPLLVLAGPGTGKTSTLVEAVAARVRRGTPPERVLVLTFSRRAAMELRDRMAARLEGHAPQAATFHSFCYAVVRAHQDRELFAEPLRLLSGPEQDLYLRELLAGQLDLARSGRAIGAMQMIDPHLESTHYWGEIEPIDAHTCEYRTGDDDLDWLALRIAMFGVDFDVHEPPELREQLRIIALRLGRASGSY